MSHQEFIRLPAVRQRIGLSKPTLYRLVERGDFPRPIALVPGGRAVAWLTSEVDAWIQSRIAEPRRGTVASQLEATKKTARKPRRGAR